MKSRGLVVVFTVFLFLSLNACNIAQIFKEYKTIQLTAFNNTAEVLKVFNQKNISDEKRVALIQLNRIINTYQNDIYPLYKKLLQRGKKEKSGEGIEEIIIKLSSFNERWSSEMTKLVFLLGNLPDRDKEEGKKFVQNAVVLSENFGEYLSKSKSLNRAGMEWNLGALSEKDRLIYNELADACTANIVIFKDNSNSFFSVLLGG